MTESESLARSTTVDLPESALEALWKSTIGRLAPDAAAHESIRPSGETLPQARAASERPSLPGYELLSEIGQGGMGVVYRARQEALGREVAVKLIRSGLDDRESRERFLAEARTTAALDHPNVVPVHELGKTPGGELFLGMKLVSGSSWRALLHPATEAERERAKTYGVERHLRVLLSVCNAVAFAHTKGVIHRDLKPENVMVGEFGEVLVMDWGLAVSFTDPAPGEAPCAHHRSTAHDLAGSPAYMAPELAEMRGKDLGPASDVYLLGGILHEVLTGRPPHAGASLVLVLKAAARSDPPAFDASVPAELAAICRRALERESARRFLSVRDLHAALEGYLEHRESARIAADARALLARAPSSTGHDRYEALAEAIAGFHQARLLWAGNEDARKGEDEARLAYANAALEARDLALARAQVARLSPELPATRALEAAVLAAMRARERSRRTGLALVVFAAVSVVAMVVGLACGIYLVSAARDAAVRERAEAERQRELAEERLRGQNRNLARVYLEKGLRAGANQDLLAAEVLFARSLELDPAPATRELVATVRLRGASQAWRCPDPTGTRELAWSPDGKTLAIAHVDSIGTALRLWDLASPSSSCRVSIPCREPVTALVFGRDGKAIAASLRTEVVTWDAATGAVISSVVRVSEGPGFALSPTLQRFAALGRNRVLSIRDAATGALVRSLPLARPGGAFAWDPSGHSLAAIDGHALRILDLESGESREIAADVEGTALAWSPGGDRIAAADGAESVRIFETRDTLELPRLVTPRAGASQLAWNHDGRLLAVAGRRGGVRVFEVTSGELRLGAGADDVTSTTFAWKPGEDALALDESGVRIIALGGRGEHRVLARRLGRVMGLAFQKGHVLALDGEGTLRAFELDGRELSREGGARRLFGLSPDGRHVLRHAGNSIDVWTLDGRPERLFSAAGGFHAWRADGLALATAGAQDVFVWGLPGGERRTRLPAPESPALALSPDGRWLARASTEPGRAMSVRLHDLPGGVTRTFVGPTPSTFRGLVFSPDSSRLACIEQPHATADSRLRIWEVASSREAHSVPLAELSANPALIWGDAHTLVSMANRVIRLFDASTGELRLDFRVADASSPATPSLAASDDGLWIAAGVSDIDLYNWRALLEIARASPSELLAEAVSRTGLRVEDDRLVPR